MALLLEPTIEELSDEKKFLIEKMRAIRISLYPLIQQGRVNEVNYLRYAGKASNAWKSGDKEQWAFYKKERDIANPYRASNAKQVNSLKEETALLLPRLAEINTILQKQDGVYFEHDISNLGDALKVESFPDNSPDWHAQRLKGIGGSDIAGIMNVSPWITREELFLLKTGQVEQKEQSGSGAMSRGHLWEPIIQNMFIHKHPELEIIQDKSSWRSNVREHQQANVDGMLRDAGTTKINGILEIKNSSTISSWDSGIPEYYRWQILWYIDTFGLDYGKLAVLVDDWDYLEFEIVPKQEEIDRMHEIVDQFVNDINQHKKENAS